ncbi:conserved hypothetical protein, partial [Ricinus communis]
MSSMEVRSPVKCNVVPIMEKYGSLNVFICVLWVLDDEYIDLKDKFHAWVA